MEHEIFTPEQEEIGARWAVLVKAAGMYSTKLNPFTLLRLGKAIIDDPTVKTRAYAQPRQHPAIIDTEQYLAALATFTPAEKDELTKRIAHRYGTAPVKGAR
jgi:hypothetical protein